MVSYKLFVEHLLFATSIYSSVSRCWSVPSCLWKLCSGYWKFKSGDTSQVFHCSFPYVIACTALDWGQEVHFVTPESQKNNHLPLDFHWWVKWTGKNYWNPSSSPRVKSPWMPSAYVRAPSPMGTPLTTYWKYSSSTFKTPRPKTIHYTLGTDNTVSVRAPYSPTISTLMKNKPQIWGGTILLNWSPTKIGLLSSQWRKAAKVHRWIAKNL